MTQPVHTSSQYPETHNPLLKKLSDLKSNYSGKLLFSLKKKKLIQTKIIKSQPIGPKNKHIIDIIMHPNKLFIILSNKTFNQATISILPSTLNLNHKILTIHHEIIKFFFIFKW